MDPWDSLTIVIIAWGVDFFFKSGAKSRVKSLQKIRKDLESERLDEMYARSSAVRLLLK